MRSIPHIDGLYTTPEVAMMLGFKAKSITTCVEQGRLKGRKVGGFWYFSQDDIDAYRYRPKVTFTAQRPRNGCKRCWLIGQLDESELCEFCREELQGSFAWYETGSGALKAATWEWLELPMEAGW